MDEVFWLEILVRNGNMCAEAGLAFSLIIYLLHFEVNYICLLCVCVNVMYTLPYYCFGEFLGYVCT